MPVPGSPKASTLTPSTKLPWSQLVQLLPQRQGDVLEAFPRSCPREAWTPGEPADAPVTPILGFLFQYLQESCQGIAVAGRGETSHRLGPQQSIMRTPPAVAAKRS